MADIILAEDDETLREGLDVLFSTESHAVRAVADGAAALRAYAARRPDLMILDVMMPEKSGLDVCRAVRRTDEATPILILSAKGTETDRVVGLELGADDYVCKPFSMRELLARVSALLRRAGVHPPAQAAEAAFASDWLFATGALDVRQALFRRHDGVLVHLLPRDVQILVALAEARGRAVSREALLERLWGAGANVTPRVVDQYLCRLRVRLGPAAACLETATGEGYRLAPTADDPPAAPASRQALVPFGPLTLDPDRLKLIDARGRERDVSRREMTLLRHFAAHPGEVVSQDAIIALLWGPNFTGTTHAAGQVIARLRETLRGQAALIESVYGAGYRYVPAR